jgi:hypothetical protein
MTLFTTDVSGSMVTMPPLINLGEMGDVLMGNPTLSGVNNSALLFLKIHLRCRQVPASDCCQDSDLVTSQQSRDRLIRFGDVLRGRRRAQPVVGEALRTATALRANDPHPIRLTAIEREQECVD